MSNNLFIYVFFPCKVDIYFLGQEKSPILEPRWSLLLSKIPVLFPFSYFHRCKIGGPHSGADEVSNLLAPIGCEHL
jgi:hypothetical protein